MDVEIDSDLSFLNTSPLLKNVQSLRICVNRYQLRKATQQVINQSNTVELQTCARHMYFYCFQRAPGIGLEDRIHSSRY